MFRKTCISCHELRLNVGLETGIWRHIVKSQTAHNKYKWLPYATEWNPSWKFTAYATEHYNNRHGSVQSGNDFSTLKIKRAWFDSGRTLLKQAFVPMEKQFFAGMLQSYVLVRQEESLIQLLENLWHHVNYAGISYYLPSDKGYERILWKLRG